MKLTRVIMRLARNPDAPQGDDSQGYVLMAPLDGDGHLDLELWRKDPRACTVRRFHPDPDEVADGWLTHRGANWFFHYDEEDEGPDEPVYRLGEHRIRAGAYLTIHEADGDDHPYVVIEA